MKKYALQIACVILSLIGLTLCCLGIVHEGQQPYPVLGLLFTNLGLWTNIYLTRKAKKGEK